MLAVTAADLAPLFGTLASASIIGVFGPMLQNRVSGRQSARDRRRQLDATDASEETEIETERSERRAAHSELTSRIDREMDQKYLFEKETAEALAAHDADSDAHEGRLGGRPT